MMSSQMNNFMKFVNILSCWYKEGNEQKLNKGLFSGYKVLLKKIIIVK